MMAKLKWHIHKPTINLVNGILMVLSFFLLRVCYYYFVIFSQVQTYILYRGVSFWPMYTEELHIWIYIALGMLLVMYILNLWWFTKMLTGLLKVLGILEVIERTEYDYKPVYLKGQSK